jgi:hypothetical protein
MLLVQIRVCREGEVSKTSVTSEGGHRNLQIWYFVILKICVCCDEVKEYCSGTEFGSNQICLF